MNDIVKSEHTTVLLHEAIDALVTDPDGFYVDGTFGRGGHTAELLSRLSSKGRVLAIDKDPQAIEAGRQRFADDSRLTIVHGSFADMGEWVEGRAITGVLVDLGVSSPQLDQAERGFSLCVMDRWICEWIQALDYRLLRGSPLPLKQILHR